MVVLLLLPWLLTAGYRCLCPSPSCPLHCHRVMLQSPFLTEITRPYLSLT